MTPRRQPAVNSRGPRLPMTVTSLGTQPPEPSEHGDAAAALAALCDDAQHSGERVNQSAINGGSLSRPADARRPTGVHLATATSEIRER